MGQRFAEKNDMLFLNVCAKTDTDQMFKQLCLRILEKGEKNKQYDLNEEYIKLEKRRQPINR